VRHTIIHRFAAVFFSPHFVVMCCFKFIYAVFLRYLSIVFLLANDDAFALLLVYGVLNCIVVHTLL